MYHLYIACCTPSGGVAHCLLDDAGRLTLHDWVKIPEPMYLALEGSTLHTILRLSTLEDENSGYTTLPLTADGVLGDPGTVQTLGGKVACHLSLLDGAVYTANYVSGSLSRLTSTGELTVVTHSGCGPHPTRQTGPHTHFIAPTPDGKYLLATDLGLDTVFTYDRELKALTFARVPEGHGVRHLAFSADGRWVYAVNELTGTVTAFAYADGRLAPCNTVPTLPTDYVGKNTAAAIRYADGLLYVSHRGHDSIAVLAAEGEQLELRRHVSCGGNGPRDFDVFGDYVVCTNEDSDTVTVLCRRGDDLIPVPGGLSLPHPLCVVGRAADGCL